MPNSPELADQFQVLDANQGSDLHLRSKEVPMNRFHGQLGRFKIPARTPEGRAPLAREILGGEEKLREFMSMRDGDAAVALPRLGRLRANLFHQRDQPGIVLRTNGPKILGLDDPLGKPSARRL